VQQRHLMGTLPRGSHREYWSDADYAAEDIANGLDGIEQKEFYDYYTGRIDTPFNHFTSEFIKATYTNAKTAGDAHRSIALFTAYCPTLKSVSAHAVMKWIDSETRSQSSIHHLKNRLHINLLDQL